MTTTTSAPVVPDRFLRTALRYDSLLCGAFGVLMAAGGAPLGSVFGVPAIVLHIAGAFLIAMAGYLAFLVTRESLSRPAVWTVIGINVVWVIDSVAVLVAGLWPVTALGILFVLAGAVTVAVFAELQYVGLRRIAR